MVQQRHQARPRPGTVHERVTEARGPLVEVRRDAGQDSVVEGQERRGPPRLAGSGTRGRSRTATDAGAPDALPAQAPLDAARDPQEGVEQAERMRDGEEGD